MTSTYSEHTPRNTELKYKPAFSGACLEHVLYLSVRMVMQGNFLSSLQETNAASAPEYIVKECTEKGEENYQRNNVNDRGCWSNRVGREAEGGREIISYLSDARTWLQALILAGQGVRNPLLALTPCFTVLAACAAFFFVSYGVRISIMAMKYTSFLGAPD